MVLVREGRSLGANAMTKQVLLYYCQSADGEGGLVRAFAIAKRLTHRFRVVILNGRVSSPAMSIPEEVEYVQLPPLRADIDDSDFNSIGSGTRQQQLASRHEIIVAKYEELKPSVILIESYPFEQGRLAEDPISLIQTARQSASGRPFIICSVKDILADTEFDKEARDDRIAGMLEANFAAVIVHSDPSFARLQEFFQPQNTLDIPVYHSGFVSRHRINSLPRRKKEERVLVSAGSGVTGGKLCRAAVEAHRLLWEIDQLPMTIITGPDLPPLQLNRLQKLARDLPELELKQSVPDLGIELSKVSWAVCQCGYNTAVDVLATGVSALLVPASNSRRVAQTERLQRLNHGQLARMLMPRHLNAASLANSIHQLVKFKPMANKFNMDGAEITSNLIYDISLSGNSRIRNLASRSNSERLRPH
jgi:predicted glycosyltransferase